MDTRQTYRICRAAPHGYPRGFTLIDLTMVLAILGILAAIGVYAWQQYIQNVNLRAATAMVISDITMSRQQAVDQGERFCIQFSENSPIYTVHRVSCNEEAIRQRDLRDAGRNIQVSSTTLNGDRMNFQPRGTVDDRRIFLSNSRGSEVEIRLSIAGMPYATFSMQ